MYSKEKANNVITFISGLTHTKGKWAGKPFALLDWQKDKVIKPLFGTIRNGLRRYRMAYLEIPKKSGKTELGAAIALNMLCADGEDGPEVYSAAADREQAGLIYHVAAQMVRNNPYLLSILKVLDSRKRIVHLKKNGFYQVLSSEVKTKHGLNPSCVIFDELHAQPNDELWRVLTSGTDYAREQQLVFVLTTAGIYNQESIWWRIREKARQVENKTIKDDSFLPILYIADPEIDDPEDEEVWKRVNPSMSKKGKQGIFSLEKIRRDFKIAKQNPIDYQDFLRFRLNIPIKQLKRWMPMQKWDACKEEIDWEKLKGQVCYGGMDLSSTQDLTAFVLVFPQKDRTIIKPYFYCPMETIVKRSRIDHIHYDVWVDEGLITATPGDYVDYGFVKKDIVEAANMYDLKEVGYDPWCATQLAGELFNDYQIMMIELRQGTKTLSEPSKNILKKILAKEMIHDGNRVLRWNADNLVMVPDANENIRPAKDKTTGRIDGFVALIMAHARAIFHAPTISIYETRGVTTIE